MSAALCSAGRLMAVVIAAWVLAMQTALAADMTFRLTAKDGTGPGDVFNWLFIGAEGVSNSQSVGDSYTTTLAEGPYTIVVMRANDQATVEASVEVGPAAQTVDVVFPPMAADTRSLRLVTLRLVSLPDSQAPATAYSWSLSHDEEVFFRKTEPGPDLTLPLEVKPTTLIVELEPGGEQATFVFTPQDENPQQTLELPWPRDQAIASSSNENERGAPLTEITLSPRIVRSEIVVDLAFVAGGPTEGDTIWLTDGRPGALAAVFVQDGATSVVLPLPSESNGDSLELIYRQSGTLAPLARVGLE